MIFPEGTITRLRGLQPFHLGGFVAAQEAGVPVIPIAIRGTRSILCSDSWFPRRGVIRVTIGPAILPGETGDPQTTAWEAAVVLRNSARAFILRHCGEPDLSGAMSTPPGLVPQHLSDETAGTDTPADHLR